MACRPIGYYLLIVSLVSCSGPKSAEDTFGNYIYRLASVLDAPKNRVTAQALNKRAPLKRYPVRRELIHDITLSKINLLDFLKLSSCDLQRHIGERNSSLGRVLQPSQRMLYEYQFIHLGQECLVQLDESSELFRVLASSLESKRAQLPLVRWNATFASQEFTTLFSSSVSPLDVKAVATMPEQLYSALDTIGHYTRTDLLQEADEQKLEQAFGVVTSSKRIGEIRHSLRLVRYFLAEADTILKSRLSARPLCFKQQPNKKFDVLQTVFTKFYIGEIQPYISKLYQQADALLTRIDGLSKRYSEPPTLFIEFWEAVFLSENSEWNLFEQSIKKHTLNWQQLLRQCGRLPS